MKMNICKTIVISFITASMIFGGLFANSSYVTYSSDDIQNDNEFVDVTTESDVESESQEISYDSKDYTFVDSELVYAEDETVTITVTGEMPEGATLSVTEVNVEDYQSLTNDDTQLVKAWDIKIIDADGDEYQPEAYNKSVEVTFSDVEQIITEDVNIIHITEDNDVEVLTEEFIDSENSTDITVETDSFSIYGISAVASKLTVKAIETVYVPLVDKAGAMYHMELTNSQGIVTEAFCIDHGKMAKSGTNFHCKGQIEDAVTDVENADKVRMIMSMYFDEKNGTDYNLSYTATQCLIWAFQKGFTSEDNIREILNNIGIIDERQDKIIEFYQNLSISNACISYVWECEKGGPENGYQRLISPVAGESTWKQNEELDADNNMLRVRLFRNYEGLVTNVYWMNKNKTYKIKPKNVTQNGVYTFDPSDFPNTGENSAISYTLYVELAQNHPQKIEVYSVYTHDDSGRLILADDIMNSDFDKSADIFNHNAQCKMLDKSLGGSVHETSLQDFGAGSKYGLFNCDVYDAGHITSYNNNGTWSIRQAANAAYYSSLVDRDYSGQYLSSGGFDTPAPRIGNGTAETMYGQTASNLDFVAFYAPTEVYTEKGEYLGDIATDGYNYKIPSSHYNSNSGNLSLGSCKGRIIINTDGQLVDLACVKDNNNMTASPVKAINGQNIQINYFIEQYKAGTLQSNFSLNTDLPAVRYGGYYNHDGSYIRPFQASNKTQFEADGITNAMYIDLETGESDSKITFESGTDGVGAFSGRASIIVVEHQGSTMNNLNIRFVGEDGKGLTAQDVVICGSTTFDNDSAIRPSDYNTNGVYTFSIQSLKDAGFSDLYLFVNNELWQPKALYTFTNGSDFFDESALSVDMPQDSIYRNIENSNRIKLNSIGRFGT